MIEELAKKNPATGRDSDRALVVIDAGISSEENLALIKEKGFHYLCVSRKNLTQVRSSANGDHYLLVNSPSKALTEESMNRQYRERFEDMLAAIRKGLSTKGGTKRYEKVCERVGRARGKYPSIQRFYDISYVLDEKGTTVTDINWTIKAPEKMDANVGIYFLRTDKPEMDICTQPTQAAAAIYDKLGFRHYPFRKMKICSAQT